MHKLVFWGRVLVGMTVQGIRAAPDKIASRQRSMSDFGFLILLGLVGMYVVSGTGTHPLERFILTAIMMMMITLVSLHLVLRKTGPRISVRRELREARDAQIARMYPCQHARLQALARGRSR